MVRADSAEMRDSDTQTIQSEGRGLSEAIFMARARQASLGLGADNTF